MGQKSQTPGEISRGTWKGSHCRLNNTFLHFGQLITNTRGTSLSKLSPTKDKRKRGGCGLRTNLVLRFFIFIL